VRRKDVNPKEPFDLAGVGLLAALVLLGRVPSLFYHFANPDEVALMAESWAMTQGQLLYKDIAQIHPPLNLAIIVPFFHIFRPEWVPLAIKTVNLLLVFLGALLIAKIAFEWLGSRALGLLGGCIFILYCSGWWALASFGEFYLIFPVLLSAWLLYFVKRPGIPVHFFTGFLWGVAFFFKQIAIFDAIGLFLGYSLLNRTSKKTMAPAAASMVLGFVSVAAVISIYFLRRDAFSEAWTSILVRSILYTNPGGGKLHALLSLARGLAGLLGLSLLAVPGVVYLVLSRRDQRDADEVRHADFFLVLLIWFGSDLLGLCTVGRFYPHYLLQLVPLVSLLPLFILSQIAGRLQDAVRISFLLVLTIYLSAHFIENTWDLARSHWLPKPVRQSAAAADFIRTHTQNDDRIFLYDTFNLDIFFLAQRLSNNGIYLFLDMVTEHMYDQAQPERKRNEFLAHLPAIIVVGRDFELNWNGEFFDHVLSKYYAVGATAEGLELYVRVRPNIRVRP
jgi:hypothetical protein